MNGLTPKQERYCLEYLVDQNATQAAIRAGYSPDGATTQGSLLLVNPKVRDRIALHQAAIAASIGVTVERIVAEYAKIAFTSMNDFTRVQKDGSAYIDFRNVTPDQWAAVQELVIDEYTEGAKGAKGNGKGEKGRDIKRMRLKLNDKKGALDSLGKHLQMFIERHEHTGRDGKPLFDFSGFTSIELESILTRALYSGSAPGTDPPAGATD